MPHAVKKAHLVGMLCLTFLLSGCSAEQVKDKLGWLDNKVGQQLDKVKEADLPFPATSTKKETNDIDKKEEGTSTKDKKKEDTEVKSVEDLSEEQKGRIDEWLQENGYNRYGDSQDAIYSGGTPLFNEKTGERINRYDYILKKFPNILERSKEVGE